MNVPFPQITGRTGEERQRQILSYLWQLASALQELPEPAPAEAQSQRSNVFSSLRVRRALSVEGQLNGICMRSVPVRGSAGFSLQSRFTQWDSDGQQRQSLLLAGEAGGRPVLGVVVISSNGSCHWEGSAGVTVSVGSDGAVSVSLGSAGSDELLLLSCGSFAIL